MNAPPRPRRQRRLNTVAIAPALLTLGNLMCGFAAVFWATRSPDITVLGHFKPVTVAAALIFGGMIFDALDGTVARLTRQISSFGAQLDSMADMITFGLAPAMLLIQLNKVAAPYFATAQLDTYFDRLVVVIGAVYAACAGLRLARFNVEHLKDTGERDLTHDYFHGLPSPGAAGTVAAMALLYVSLVVNERSMLARITSFGIVIATLAVAAAMISNLRYSHVINRYFRGRGTFNYVAMIAVVVILALTIPQWSIAVGFVAYVLSAPAAAVFKWAKGLATREEDDEEPIDDADAREDSAEGGPTYRIGS